MFSGATLAALLQPVPCHAASFSVAHYTTHTQAVMLGGVRAGTRALPFELRSWRFQSSSLRMRRERWFGTAVSMLRLRVRILSHV
jgi:hypothetical protein